MALAILLSLLASACSTTVEIELGDTTGARGDTSQPTATPDDTAAPATPSDSDGTVPTFSEPDPDPTLLSVDDDLRIGRLDNGLTYYVRSNGAPGSALELRLVVDAGSMQQETPDSGVAHFVEHMLFNGTTGYPDNTLDEVLRSFGMDFGADINAYTGYDETVYILSVPSNDDDSVDTAFDVLREWATEATLEPAQVEAEKGVLVEELRLYDGDPFAPIDEAFDLAYTKGTAYENRDPGGTEANIRSTDPDDLERFYRRWYRPDLMAVVAVGDLPASELENRIVDLFSDLGSPPEAPERDEPAVAMGAEPYVQVLEAPAQPEKFISIDFALPAWDLATIGGERLAVIEDLMGLMVQSRLSESSATGASELIDPFAAPFPFTRARSFFGFNADAPDLAEGTAFILREMHRLRVTGFGRDEFDRAVSTYRSRLRSELSSAPTTQDRGYASRYVRHYLDGADVSDARDRFDRLSTLLDRLEPTDVDNHLRWMMATSAPIVILVSPEGSDLPTDAELADVVESAEKEGLSAAGVDGPRVDTVTSLMTAPEPRDPVESGPIPDVDGSSWWRFDNGVTVAFVPSDISAGAVDLFAAGAGGWSLLTADQVPLAEVAMGAVTSSGLADLGRATLERFLADSTAWIEPYIDETSEGFVGGADAVDLETMMQLLHLLVEEPRVDEVGLRSARAAAEDTLRATTTDPRTVLFAELLDAAYAGDPYQTALSPTPEQIDSLDAGDLLDLYESRLGKVDDMVVVVVGDADEDTVEGLARTYLGTLSPGVSDSWRDTTPDVSDGVERVIRFGDPDSPGGLALFYSVETEADLDVRASARVLEIALDARLNDTVREEFGATYGAATYLDFYDEPDELIEILIVVDGDPTRMDLIADVVAAQIGDLVVSGIEADEMQSAAAVVRAELDFIDNGYLIDRVLAWARDPGEDPFDRDDQIAALDRVDPDDVDAVADLLFVDGARVQVLRVPVG